MWGRTAHQKRAAKSAVVGGGHAGTWLGWDAWATNLTRSAVCEAGHCATASTGTFAFACGVPFDNTAADSAGAFS
jgi:hypothetical protein